jgi:malate dehydrogenase (quinone)
VICAADGSLAALLGASPGASTAVSIMLDVLARCFPDQINSPAWEAKMKNIIPTYGQSLADDAELCANTRKRSSELLGLL